MFSTKPTYSQASLLTFFISKMFTFISVFVVTVVTALFFLFRLKSSWSFRRNDNHVERLQNSSPASSKDAKAFTNCTSAGCVRCKNYNNLTDNLEQKLNDYLQRTSGNKVFSPGPDKLNQQQGLERLSNSLKITTHNESPSRNSNAQNPTVMKLHNLTAKPWYHKSDICMSDLTILENAFTTIWNEFSFVYEDFLDGKNQGWFSNSVPTGMWSVFHLYNQGVKSDHNCARCPETTQILERMSSFMSGIAFGNATFSVLQAGTRISEHYGPCNLRVRCHLGLQIPPGCTLTVANQQRQWKEGGLLLFDDSYLHEANHNGMETDGPRIIFMVDLWHPQVTDEEKKALKYLFAV